MASKKKPPQPGRVLRMPEVEGKTGLSKYTIWNKVDAGEFPRPINLGPRAQGWIESEIDDWILEKMGERDG